LVYENDSVFQFRHFAMFMRYTLLLFIATGLASWIIFFIFIFVVKLLYSNFVLK